MCGFEHSRIFAFVLVCMRYLHLWTNEYYQLLLLLKLYSPLLSVNLSCLCFTHTHNSMYMRAIKISHLFIFRRFRQDLPQPVLAPWEIQRKWHEMKWEDKSAFTRTGLQPQPSSQQLKSIGLLIHKYIYLYKYIYNASTVFHFQYITVLPEYSKYFQLRVQWHWNNLCIHIYNLIELNLLKSYSFLFFITDV